MEVFHYMTCTETWVYLIAKIVLPVSATSQNSPERASQADVQESHEEPEADEGHWHGDLWHLECLCM